MNANFSVHPSSNCRFMGNLGSYSRQNVNIRTAPKTTEAENGHRFFIFYFYALLSCDNDLLSHYLQITKIVFS